MVSPVLLAHALILLQLICRLLDLGLERRHDVASGPGHSETEEKNRRNVVINSLKR